VRGASARRPRSRASRAIGVSQRGFHRLAAERVRKPDVPTRPRRRSLQQHAVPGVASASASADVLRRVRAGGVGRSFLLFESDDALGPR
jgi:hypothetical protein